MAEGVVFGSTCPVVRVQCDGRARFAPISVHYGCLVAADLDNLRAAGRHIATDQPTQAFMREIPQCWLTGQAAGAAAAIAAGTGVLPKALDTRELQDELRAQGVHLQDAAWADGPGAIERQVAAWQAKVRR